MALPIVVALWAGLAATIVPMAVRLLVGLGFGVVVYTGIGAAWDAAQAAIWSNLGAVASNVLTIILMARVDDAIQIVLSAAGSLLLVKGFNAVTGGIARGRWSAPSA
jgi:Protein of unknown function (DUF2523)